MVDIIPSKKKIIFFLHFPPPIHGSSMMGKQIIESKLINEKFSCEYINLGTSRSINEIAKNPFKKIFIYINILFATLYKLLFFKPDLCYVAITAKGIAFFKDSIISLFIKLFSVKIIYHFHNKGVINYQDNFLYNLFYKAVFHNSKAILLSKQLYYDIRKYVPESSVYYCPNGIPDRLSSESRYLKKKKELFRLLFISNLIKSKGVFILLEACKILKNKNLNFECIIIGAECEISKITLEQKISEFNLGGIVQYHGPKFGDQKDKYLLDADIFVFPTYDECFPIVIIEAMQFSLPVISSFEGGIPDLVIDGETGFLCKQRDSICLSEKIEFLIRDLELREKMGTAGRKRYLDYFTFEHYERKLIEILENTLNEKI